MSKRYLVVKGNTAAVSLANKLSRSMRKGKKGEVVELTRKEMKEYRDSKDFFEYW